jgi:ABC-type sugar transport system substrate-binding protein
MRAAPPKRRRSTRGARRRADGRRLRIQRRLQLVVDRDDQQGRRQREQAGAHRVPVLRGGQQLRRPMLAAAQAVAKDNNSTIKVFDADNDPKKQFAQLQTATSSGDYDAIIVQPIFGTGLITGVQDAIAAGKKVVNMDQILGEALSTDQPQVDGLSGNVVFVPTEIGTKLGKLVTQACQEKSLDPCKVGYLFDIKASALDLAIKKSFDDAIAGSPVKVVAQARASSRRPSA